MPSFVDKGVFSVVEAEGLNSVDAGAASSARLVMSFVARPSLGEVNTKLYALSDDVRLVPSGSIVTSDEGSE